ncbi:MAG: glycosyltransferase family A protein [Lachnospiraceae bacterium]|nr:glycosyltransferase family A protein [Lachnospiraceae bacterium]
MKETITFIVPAYNAESTIRQTIDSILCQTTENYRVLIVDDGSRDATGAISRQYAADYPDKITYLYQDNKGLGGARNLGIEKVETGYLSFLDSDDWLMPDYVERIGTCLEKYKEGKMPEMILVLPVIYDERSRRYSDWYDKERFEQIFHEDGAVINPSDIMEVYQLEVSMCRKVVRADFLRKISFRFREGIKWEDVVPHFYLLSNCHFCMGIISTGFYYRIGVRGQITASRGRERLDFITVMEELMSFLTQCGNEKLIFPVMRVIIRFSVWCIRMADCDVRVELVERLHQIYRRMPSVYPKILWQEAKKQYPLYDAMQYLMFWISIRYPCFHFIWKDYLWQEICSRIVKKMLHAKERVS